jgi:hypothetical protein
MITIIKRIRTTPKVSPTLRPTIRPVLLPEEEDDDGVDEDVGDVGDYGDVGDVGDYGDYGDVGDNPMIASELEVMGKPKIVGSALIALSIKL